VAEASTGRGREIWRAKAGRGSVFRVVEGEDQLLWADGDRLVFPWEGDGWTHLYSVAAAGGEAVLLTPGEFEVEQVALGRDGKQVVYSSNQGDRERRMVASGSGRGRRGGVYPIGRAHTGPAVPDERWEAARPGARFPAPGLPPASDGDAA
jgi:dipeptidyl aminopeptidase/acylaminoacyl peptidase